MIEFRGEMSERCKRYIANREGRHCFIVGLIVAVLFSIPAIFLAIEVDLIFIIWVPMLFLIALFSRLPPRGKAYDLIIPTQVTIDRGVITSKGKKFCYNIMVDHVKVVVDMGDWYHIFFHYRYRNQRFVCEKKLIYSGTIKEFERTFRGKIIKKSDKRLDFNYI